MKIVKEFKKAGSYFEFELDGSEGLGLGAGFLGSEPWDGDAIITFLPKDSDKPLRLASATGGGSYGRIISDTSHCERPDLLRVIRQLHKMGRWHGVQA